MKKGRLQTILSLLLIFFGTCAEGQEWNSIVSIFSNFESEGVDIEISNNKQYFAGVFENSGSIGFNSIQGIQHEDIFIGKADLSGYTEWLISIPGNQIDRASAIAIYGDTVAVTGIYTDTLFVGDDTLHNLNQKSTFIAFFDTTGNYLSCFSPQTYNANFRDIAFDLDGNILLCGEFFQNFDYGGFHMSEIAGLSMFLLKYDPLQDTILWAAHASGSTSLAERIAVDSQNNIAVTGSYNEGTYFIDTLINAGNGNHNFFLSKFDSDGNKLWLKTVEGTGEVHGYGVDIDTDGNIYAIGEFEGDIYHEQVLHNSTGDLDVVVIKYDGAGNFKWTKTFGGPDSDEGYDIEIDPNNDILILADVGFNASIDQTALNLSGWTEPIIVKLSKTSGDLIDFLLLSSTISTGIVDGRSLSLDNGFAGITGINRTSVIMGGNEYPAANSKDFYTAILHDTLHYFLTVNQQNLPTLSIFPNPATEKITILGIHGIGDYRIYDISGIEVTRGYSENNEVTLDVSALSSGVYSFTLYQEGIPISIKVVVN